LQVEGAYVKAFIQNGAAGAYGKDEIRQGRAMMVTQELMNATAQERVAEARRLQREAEAANKPPKNASPRGFLSSARSSAVALPNFLARRFRTAAP
jgi:hypothetical protein